MSFINRKHIKIGYSIFFLVLLNNCQLSKTNKSHGINFIENRGKILIVGKTNKNDIIKIIGNPHTTSITGNNTWIYFEYLKLILPFSILSIFNSKQKL